MTMALPANLPNVASARLPEKYEAAKAQLAECARVDECQEWADKMAALASYARQADDDELERFARKVRARAINRCGELLREIQTAEKGGRPPKNPDGGDIVSRSQAARDAGLSERQKVTALRVAAIPKEEFERQVESDNPPTITELARQGTQTKHKPLTDLGGRDPADFKLATQIGGSIRYFAEELESVDPAAVIRGFATRERGEILGITRAVSAWLARFTKQLEDSHGV